MTDAASLHHDYRQRFYIEHSPVRGDIVRLQDALQTILAQRDYPPAVALMLGEMLIAATLLATTLKFKGRLSLQAQGSGALKWVMAECTDAGEVRGLAEWDTDSDLHTLTTSEEALASLTDAVLFINIEPEHGERYQGIVPLTGKNIAECITEYYDLSAQIPTRLAIASDMSQAAGLLIQLLPRQEDEQDSVDQDLWPRITLLAETLTANELLSLPATEILHRLYHEEEVRLAPEDVLKFGCTCSRERCINALIQVGQATVEDILATEDEVRMDCQFCNTEYRFGPVEAMALFGHHLS